MKLHLIISLVTLFGNLISAQIHLNADPYFLVSYENKQFEGILPNQPSIFRPIFIKTDSLAFSFHTRNEFYFNDNNPNQENMDVRYFSKGMGAFNSFQLTINSPYFTFLFEPYNTLSNYKKVNTTKYEEDLFSVVNSEPLSSNDLSNGNVRNFLTFFHYKGLGFGWHKGNRWWGPGIHSSLQMTNNTSPFMGQIFGTINEIRFGRIGLYGLYNFTRLNNKKGNEAIYLTSILAQINYYGSIILTLGVNRNYLSGGYLGSKYIWSERDAKKIIFEGLFISNLINTEYTVGGHDQWDQTLSLYGVVTMPKRNLKLYAEFGINDNRMYFADFLSQPDHSLATIIGIRDYGDRGKNKFIWGFEWTNLMISYSSRHRPTGPGTWYNKSYYQYSSYNGRRWAAHSGPDSDDWYLYLGYLSDNLMIVPAFNYERHGIVSHRPAEVKLEYRLDIRRKYYDFWFGVYFEKQFEAFLGFPDYFYTDSAGNATDYYSSDRSKLASTRNTNTLILSISKYIQF